MARVQTAVAHSSPEFLHLLGQGLLQASSLDGQAETDQGKEGVPTEVQAAPTEVQAAPSVVQEDPNEAVEDPIVLCDDVCPRGVEGHLLVRVPGNGQENARGSAHGGRGVCDRDHQTSLSLVAYSPVLCFYREHCA